MHRTCYIWKFLKVEYVYTTLVDGYLWKAMKWVGE